MFGKGEALGGVSQRRGSGALVRVCRKKGRATPGWFHFGSLLKPSNKGTLKKGHCQDLGASCVFGSLRMGHLLVFKGEVHLGRMYETHSTCKGTAQTAHFAFLFVGGFTPRDLQYFPLGDVMSWTSSWSR